jgi:two-component system cell cycle sensor histidine kinase/response regulator CckA
MSTPPRTELGGPGMDDLEVARALCEVSADFTVVARADGAQILCASPSLCERVGWSAAQIADGNQPESALWADAAERRRLHERLASEPSVEHFATRFRTRQGEIFDVTLSARLTKLGGALAVVYGAPADDAARVRANLVSTELEVLLRTIGDGVITADASGRVVSINDEAVRLTQWSAEEARGRPLREVFNVARAEYSGNPDPLSDVFNKRRTVATWPRAALTARDGEQRHIAESVSVLPRGVSGGFGVVVAFRDVTAQTKLEAEVQKSQRLEAVSMLAGGIAHDLNNILLGVLGNAGLVAAECREPALLERLARLERAGLRARSLTQQLLALATEKQPPVTPKPVRAVLTEAIELVLSGKKLPCDLEIAPSADACMVDAHQIGRVIHNLVINAVQAQGETVPPTTKPIRVLARLVDGASFTPPHDGSFIRIDVSDRGPGIAPDVRERMFEPYFTTKATGSGLGLPVAHRIVREQGGFITVDSEVSVGTTISIYLPSGTHSGSKPFESLAPPPRDDARRGSVLLVEDDDVVAQIASSMLSSLGCSVTHAKCERDALVAWSRVGVPHPFDLLFMDLNLEGSMGGCSCLRRLRDVGCDAPAVLSTGAARDPAFVRFREYGFDAVLAKPYSLRELGRVLDSVLQPRVNIPR